MVLYKKFVLNDYKESLIVTDDNISRLYGIVGDNVYLLPQGESAKSFDNVKKLCKWLLRKSLQRDGKIVAVGGGSVGDTVGFACSVYKRGGVKLTHVPTTLLAQIDSSIGGKTAIDLDGIKNAVGSFYNADTVIDVDFLKTLDDVQKESGLGELFKYRMLSSTVEKAFHGDITEEVIKACVEYKEKICELDSHDHGIRKTLNFGHTVGHGLELVFGIPHGVAVANGMYYETAIALRLGKCSKEYAYKWTNEIQDNFALYPVNNKVIKAMSNDKKNADGKICFMLPSDFDESYLDLDQVKNIICCD